MAAPSGLGPYQQSWCEDELSSTGGVWAAAKPVQAESWASRKGAPTWEDLHYFWRAASSKGIRAENGSNTTSLTDSAMSFIPWAEKEQPRVREKITQRWAEAETRTKSLCLLPLSGRQGDVLEHGVYPWWRTQALPFVMSGDPTLYLGSRNEVLSWDSRKALARCRADACEALLGQHSASPFLEHPELPSFCPVAAALPSNKGMNPSVV